MRIKYTSRGSVGFITLCNPPHNSLTHPVFADAEELQSFLADPELKAVLVQGEGRNFCDGADLVSLRKQLADPEDFCTAITAGRELLEILSFATIPVVSLIRGGCLGAGLEIALACHFRISSSNAMFGFPEAGLGFMPGLGGATFSLDSVSHRSTIDLILSARMIRAPEAMSLGFVDRVVPTPELRESGMAFVRSLTDKRPAKLIRSAMSAIHHGRTLPTDQALRRETELFCEVVREHVNPE